MEQWNFFHLLFEGRISFNFDSSSKSLAPSGSGLTENFISSASARKQQPTPVVDYHHQLKIPPEIRVIIPHQSLVQNYPLRYKFHAIDEVSG
jgi:hypothetical protein